jgi:hypothetical protein
MEMLNVDWADLFVYSDVGGEKKALRVRSQWILYY